MASKKQRKNPFTRDRGTIDGSVASAVAGDKDKEQWKYTGERNTEYEVCILFTPVNNVQYHGQGRLQHVSLDYYYEGQWKYGMREGAGTQQFPTGEIYKGEWVQDKMHGTGEIVYPNGDSFEGTWEEGKRVYGTLTIPSPGTADMPNKKMEYRGAFANSMPGNLQVHTYLCFQGQ